MLVWMKIHLYKNQNVDKYSYQRSSSHSPLHFKDIFSPRFTQVLPDRLVSCPSSGGYLVYHQVLVYMCNGYTYRLTYTTTGSNKHAVKKWSSVWWCHFWSFGSWHRRATMSWNMLWEMANGGGEQVRPRSELGKWKNMLIVSEHSNGVGSLRIMVRRSGKSISLRNAIDCISEISTTDI